MRKESLFIGVFKKKINRSRLKEYCDFFNLEKKEATKELKDRGYQVANI